MGTITLSGIADHTLFPCAQTLSPGWCTKKWDYFLRKVPFLGSGSLARMDPGTGKNWYFLVLPPPPESQDQDNAENCHQIRIGHEKKYLLGHRHVGMCFLHGKIADCGHGHNLFFAMGCQLERLRQIRAGMMPPHMHAICPQPAGSYVENPAAVSEIGGPPLLAVLV